MLIIIIIFQKRYTQTTMIGSLLTTLPWCGWTNLFNLTNLCNPSFFRQPCTMPLVSVMLKFGLHCILNYFIKVRLPFPVGVSRKKVGKSCRINWKRQRFNLLMMRLVARNWVFLTKLRIVWFALIIPLVESTLASKIIKLTSVTCTIFSSHLSKLCNYFFFIYRGDSGGPIMGLTSHDVPYQAGIVSWVRNLRLTFALF